MPPPLRRERGAQSYGTWQGYHPSVLDQNESVFFDDSSDRETDRTQIIDAELSTRPGERFYFIGSAWNRISSWADFSTPLDLNENPKHENSLLGDLNYLAMKQEDYIKKNAIDADISIIAFEIDSKKMHLA